MKKFVALFAIPAASIKDWMASVSEEERDTQMQQMMKEWNDWIAAHESIILDKGLPLGKTKHVDANGVTDVVNDLNWYLVFEAESPEAAAELFVDHPHIKMIPTAYVEIMDASRVM